MLLSLIFIAAGLMLLTFAGDALVKGAVSLALKLGLPSFVVALTVVAFGTSAPELVVAVQSALEGAPGIAFGNVVGSNTANVLLVMGVPALIFTMHTVATADTRRSFMVMIGASVLFILLCFIGPFFIWQGVLLLALLAWMIVDAVRAAKRRGDTEVDADDLEGGDAAMAPLALGLYLIGGLIGLPLGAHLLVEGAVDVARWAGMTEAVIGLTIVAIGTSLPELAATFAAAKARQTDVALGNIIGSNLFNILAIMGVASFFGPLPVPPEILRLDLWVMLAASLILAPFVFRSAQFGRAVGFAFCALYAIYLAVLIN